MKSDQARNLDPHKAARLAMYLYGHEYASQGGGSMDFWDRLDARRKRLCRECVENIEQARVETAVEKQESRSSR